MSHPRRHSGLAGPVSEHPDLVVGVPVHCTGIGLADL